MENNLMTKSPLRPTRTSGLAHGHVWSWTSNSYGDRRPGTYTIELLRSYAGHWNLYVMNENGDCCYNSPAGTYAEVCAAARGGVTVLRSGSVGRSVELRVSTSGAEVLVGSEPMFVSCGFMAAALAWRDAVNAEEARVA
jgi:hypothetical protein